ncbi:hypothetical protein AAFF_G00149410 [Aldrovandia affinis]|uniref:Uncharacterized protein n=1 Tax=Aldrovandia affinis TaxID=143900 RepID=A0AAD7R0P7_9TELE|nr:hypothetical protein AAFF_G00149410 [Aldrovandia affinis]
MSTKDATGLDEKLDRKKSVEQHNSHAQQRFADQMEAMFTEMQTAVEQQGAKQQAMLSSYKCSVASCKTYYETIRKTYRMNQEENLQKKEEDMIAARRRQRRRRLIFKLRKSVPFGRL